MRKIINSFAVAALCGSLCGCGMQSIGQSGAGVASLGNAGVIGSTDITNAIGNVISVFGSGIMTNKSSIVGKWVYAKPAVQFESSNLLAQAGGAVAASQIETKLDSYYRKVGITPGKLAFVFGQDNTVQYTIGNNTMTGTYQFDSKNLTVTITTKAGISIKAYVSVSVNQMALSFDASKLLSLVGTATSKSSSLSGINSLSGQFSGMKLGFTFSK